MKCSWVWMWFLVGALIHLWPSAAEAQRSRGLTFGATQELSTEGLSFRIPRGAVPVGLSQPQVYLYRRSDGEVLERFAPRDLWYPSVFLGRWEDPSGAALVLGKLGPFPPDVDGRLIHMSHEEFHVAQSPNHDSIPNTWAELSRWLELFVGVAPVDDPRSIPVGPRLAAAFAVDFDASAPSRAAYFFRMAPTVHAVDPEQWFVAAFEWPTEWGRRAVLRDIEGDFIGSLSTIARVEDVQDQAATRFQPMTFDERSTEARPATFLESRERAINSIRGMPGWWFAETPNYVLVSDLSRGQSSFIQRLQEDLENMRSAYERIIPPRQPIAAVSLVRVFADGDEYVRYVGANLAHTGGVWMPSKRELVVRSFDLRNEREQRSRLAQIVYHEAFHQYIYYAFDYMTPAAWYNEGHATFFEGADSRRGEFRVDEVERYAQVVEALAQRGPLPVEAFLALDYDTFYQRGGGQAGQQLAKYALSWGLIYYLRKGASVEEENDYEKILPRYEDAFWETRNPDQATNVAFADVDMAEFIASFTDFWSSSRRRHRARRNHVW